MEVVHSLIAVSTCVILLLCGWKILNWAWIRPKKLEKFLRQQGFRGNSYRLLFGDLRESAQMDEEAKAKPMNFTNDIIPRVIPFLNKLIKEYGKNSFIWNGPKPAVLILEPEHIREILTKNYVYQKQTSDPIYQILGQSLASYNKDKWTKHRRLINPCFNLENLKNMLPAFELSCSKMLSKWENVASAEGSNELDAWPYLLTVTADAISRAAFGSNFEEGRKIFELGREQIEQYMQHLQSLSIPGMSFLPTKRNRRLKAIVKHVELTVLNKRMKAIEAGQPSNNDLLGIMLESNFKEIQQCGNERSGMTFEEIINECIFFYFAGQETTATLLVWTLILLSKHQDWQIRARDEVLQIFGKNKPDYEGLNHLKVITMILHEVLRLYPPGVVLDSRVISDDIKLGEQTLPAGTDIIVPPIFLYHDENIWGSDAKEFKPERFSEGVAQATKGQLVYFPFSWGPRTCIGQNFAMLEAKEVLAMILQRFSFELSPLYAHAPCTLVNLQPQYGAQLILHKL